MTYTFTARKLTLKDTFKAHAEKKLTKLDKFFSKETDAHITVTHEKDRFIVELTIRDSHYIYRAEDTGIDIIDTFDDAIDSVIRQIRKNKTKLEKRHRSAVYDESIFTEPVEEDDEFRVVRSKKFTIKPLDIEEAILQMNLLSHQFFVFRNAESGDLNVVYRRNNGDYGLIEPENE